MGVQSNTPEPLLPINSLNPNDLRRPRPRFRRPRPRIRGPRPFLCFWPWSTNNGLGRRILDLGRRRGFAGQGPEFVGNGQGQEFVGNGQGQNSSARPKIRRPRPKRPRPGSNPQGQNSSAKAIRLGFFPFRVRLGFLLRGPFRVPFRTPFKVSFKVPVVRPRRKFV